MKNTAIAGARTLPQPHVPDISRADAPPRRSSPVLQAVRLQPRPAPELAPRIFDSFWIAGYEGGDHLVDMCQVTQHQAQAEADYARLADFGIRTVRETIGWRRVDRAGRYDFSSLQGRLDALRSQHLQAIWTLCHYGWPDDVDVLSADFIDRFARYARAVAQYLADAGEAAPVYVPINELSFLASAACGNGPSHCRRAGLDRREGEVRKQLVRASVAACAAIREVDPTARFMHTDPLVRVAAPPGRPELLAEACRRNELQYAAWDMVSGRSAPELGGDPSYLDFVGLHYYRENQWELGTGRTLRWRVDDPRRVALSRMLQEVHGRYGRPLVIAETGHFGIERSAWLREIGEETRIARQHGVPVQGVCLYPVIDTPAWDNINQWNRSGLWDLELQPSGVLQRRLDPAYAAALREVQRSCG